jgi:hypothetical protein
LHLARAAAALNSSLLDVLVTRASKALAKAGIACTSVVVANSVEKVMISSNAKFFIDVSILNV